MGKDILYERLSEDKEDKSQSIETQDSRLKSVSKLDNREIFKIYIDNKKSASIRDEDIEVEIVNDKLVSKLNLTNRPDFYKLLIDSKSGVLKNNDVDTLRVTRWDRFSRNIIFQRLVIIFLHKYGIRVIPSDDSTDPFIRNIYGSMNEREAERIGERVNFNRNNKFDKGIFPGKPPFGYRIIKGIISVDKVKADIVKKIFEMASNGLGYKEICNSIEYSTKINGVKKNIKLSPQVYYNIIRNKAYIGIIEFKGEEKKGEFPTLISEEDFRKANKI